MYSELVQRRGEVISRAQGLVGFWFDTKTNSPPTAGAKFHLAAIRKLLMLLTVSYA